MTTALRDGDSPRIGPPGELAVKLGQVVRRLADGTLPLVYEVDFEATPTAFRPEHQPGDPLWHCRYRVDGGSWIEGQPPKNPVEDYAKTTKFL
jgi:hypothetical protein